ncbi:MAG: PD-(D/E)XK nuclease family transposase [Sphaerochaetaceae bacterium]|nr:PD-(D/E)XK nuclease family transposase [Sphaerochaetaceae bacterium]
MTRKTSTTSELWLKNATLMDDLFMTMALNDKKAVKEFLRIILNIDLEITSVTPQAKLVNGNSKAIVLDILALDEKGNKYDIEIQKARINCLSQRARYYSAVLDCNSLSVGKSFDEMASSWVIFILEKDIFKKGCPLYHCEKFIIEAGDFAYDGSHIVYVNGEYAGEDEIGSLMKDFKCTEVNEVNNKVLKDRYTYCKDDKEGATLTREQYDDNMLKQEIEVTERVTKSVKTESALNMLKDNMSLEMVSKYSGLSIDIVKQLRTQL